MRRSLVRVVGSRRSRARREIVRGWTDPSAPPAARPGTLPSSPDSAPRSVRQGRRGRREVGLSPASGGRLRVEGLVRRFGEVVAVDGIDLTLADGEFLTLLGPSGCGKTTVLRLVAGFETPDAGRVLFDGEDVTDRPPQARGFGMVFQNYALFPHLDVADNVAFGLRSRRRPEEEVRRRVERSLERVDLAGFGERRVQQLSGGQQQRVALARALAIEPPLLLLDEPLSNLDAALRERTRTELRMLVKSLGITALFVTHDQEEAFDLSDRVAVMREGRIRQVGTPEELYTRPADRFVAGFVGRANALAAVLETGQAGLLARLRIPDGGAGGGPAWPVSEGAGSAGQPVELLVRPEDLEVVPAASAAPAGPDASAGSSASAASAVSSGPAAEGGGAADDTLEGTVEDRRFRGAAALYRVRPEGGGALLEVQGSPGLARPGDRVGLRPRPGARLHAFPEAGSAPPDAGGPGSASSGRPATASSGRPPGPSTGGPPRTGAA